MAMARKQTAEEEMRIIIFVLSLGFRMSLDFQVRA
jgi:hypothetical protein